MDIPKEGKIHKSITPLIGSFPIFILSLVCVIYLNPDNSKAVIFKIFLFSYLFLLLGYLDDRYSLNAYLKLGLSFALVFVAVNSVELLVINKIYIETFNKFIIFNDIKIFFTILCILLLINALNLLDGINGLASGFASFWLLSLSLLLNDEKISSLFWYYLYLCLLILIKLSKGSIF